MKSIGNDDKLISKLKITCEVENVDKIILGTPGAHTQMGVKVEEFAKNLRKFLDKEILLWDERLTTVEAQNLGKRSADIDSLSAAIILQSYLDANRQENSNENENKDDN